MKLKTATLLAIFGAAFMTVTYGLELMAGYLAENDISVEFYLSLRPGLESINLVGRFLIMIFFIILYKNQK
jgi:hypothetical protein